MLCFTINAYKKEYPGRGTHTVLHILFFFVSFLALLFLHQHQHGNVSAGCSATGPMAEKGFVILKGA